MDLALLKRAHAAYVALIEGVKNSVTAEQLAELQKSMLVDFKKTSAEILESLQKYANGRNCNGKSRGFFILGPEGWKQFNSEERLIMAMYSSGKPIISTMNELSERALRADQNSPEVQLVFVREVARINEAAKNLRVYDGDSPETAIDAIEGAINGLAGKKP
jgi:hypothetical protein